jgi:CDP-6-deoxy-D-xylo-4-hexulose-3-dehydrase
LGDEEIEAATEVLRSRRTTMGEKVEQFEEEFARSVGAEYGIMVNSGSSADLLIAMSARNKVNIVALPVVTWPTHVWSWLLAGARVQFIDADPLNVGSFDLPPDVDAIHVAHLMGVPCDMDLVREAVGDRLIYEDCCEALGATYDNEPVGTFGEAASWSFFFSHHITTMEGGMVTTSDAELADRLRSLRSHGWERHKGGDPYTFVSMGFNLRPTEIAAAIGLVQLSKLGEMNKIRQENRDIFASALVNPLVTLPDVPAKAQPAWFGLPMFVENRDGLAAYLEANGVETRPILGGNLLRQPAFSNLSVKGMDGADHLHDHGLYVGLHPDPDSDVRAVATLINEYQ